jgi:hypothetical protein
MFSASFFFSWGYTSSFNLLDEARRVAGGVFFLSRFFLWAPSRAHTRQSPDFYIGGLQVQPAPVSIF